MNQGLQLAGSAFQSLTFRLYSLRFPSLKLSGCFLTSAAATTTSTSATAVAEHPPTSSSLRVASSAHGKDYMWASKKPLKRAYYRGLTQYTGIIHRKEAFKLTPEPNRQAERGMAGLGAASSSTSHRFACSQFVCLVCVCQLRAFC